ncbi:MAG: hypothetical protein EOO73_05980 [Myxococcales bacterium]|nr:MAG: hypothetical protein EOO73_05980 [Myxococcales bacterium]
MTTVRVHPRFVVPYYSMYLEGLVRLFGDGSIRYDGRDFPDSTEFNDGFAFTIESGAGRDKRHGRFYISANDFARVDGVALDWCDRYGIVNAAPAEDYPDKLLALGPSFGIRQWGSLRGTYRDVAEIFARMRYPARELYRRLRAMRGYFFERLSEQELLPGQSDASYVYFVAWPWQKHADVNPPRARFMRACRDLPTIHFEGGFSPRRRGAMPELDEITAERHYPYREWVALTRRSAAVFNNAAVHQCLGWKLGEFLALGKAIVSLPLTRRVPGELAHGEHVHFVADDEEAMKDAVERITRDHDYRKRLERGARAYYLQYLSPQRVVSRLVSGQLSG